MSTTTSISTTYAGEAAGKYISAALLSAPTLEKGLVTIKPNIKYKEVVKKLTQGSLLKDGTCDFDATGTITLTERILEPKELQVNNQLCKKDFRSDWDAISMGYSAFDNLPPTFADFLVANHVAKVAAENEVNIWRGVATTSGQFDGFATLLALDANLPAANEVAGTTVTSANAVAELQKIVDAIPPTLYGLEGGKIFVAQNIFKAYVQALGGYAANGVGASGTDTKGSQWYSMGSGLQIDGVQLEMVQGLAANTAIFAQTENLWFGTGLLNDTNEVKVIDMADIDGSQNVRIVMRMTGGVQYGNVEEIVTYGIVNSAN